jgi:hypothetical protein
MYWNDAILQHRVVLTLQLLLCMGVSIRAHNTGGIPDSRQMRAHAVVVDPRAPEQSSELRSKSVMRSVSVDLRVRGGRGACGMSRRLEQFVAIVDKRHGLRAKCPENWDQWLKPLNTQHHIT